MIMIVLVAGVGLLIIDASRGHVEAGGHQRHPADTAAGKE